MGIICRLQNNREEIINGEIQEFQNYSKLFFFAFFPLNIE